MGRFNSNSKPNNALGKKASTNGKKTETFLKSQRQGAKKFRDLRNSISEVEDDLIPTLWDIIELSQLEDKFCKMYILLSDDFRRQAWRYCPPQLKHSFMYKAYKRGQLEKNAKQKMKKTMAEREQLRKEEKEKEKLKKEKRAEAQMNKKKTEEEKKKMEEENNTGDQMECE